MKVISYIKYVALGMTMLLAFNSCNEEDQSEFSDITEVESWIFDTHLSFTQEVGKEAFIWEKNILTLAEYWLNEEVVLNGTISTSLNPSQFSKIDFYITVEEKDGYNYSPPFDRNGKFIATVTDISDEGNFALMLYADDTYQLFDSNFINDRSQTKVYEGDLFEIHWVITNVDGSTLDSREFAGGEYRYSFQGKYQELAPPVWQDTYNFEWIEAYSILVDFYGITVGGTGTITILESDIPGTYNISNMWFVEAFPIPGVLVFDFDSGLTTVSDAYGFGITWHLSNINESSIDIELIGTEVLFPFAGTGKSIIRLTRQDGANWPSNIHH